MSKYLSFLTGGDCKANDALEDAYRIHGDGVATMIPEKLVQRPEFQKNLERLGEIELYEPPNTDESNSDI